LALIGLVNGLSGVPQGVKVTRLVWTTRPHRLTSTVDSVFGITHDGANGQTQVLNRLQHLCSDGIGALIGHLRGLQGQWQAQFSHHVQDIVPFLGLHGINAQKQSMPCIEGSVGFDAGGLCCFQQAEEIDDKVHHLAARDREVSLRQLPDFVERAMFPKAPPPDLHNDVKAEAEALQTQSSRLRRNKRRVSVLTTRVTTPISQADQTETSIQCGQHFVLNRRPAFQWRAA
jgi:hypothetical protein